ncbi:MAG TPA: GntR family transcriptional regulator [Smithella sp.]|nr:FadR family transcriptional regulator [Smithella sp.]MDM7988151.1 GntR family transcriptional regulator [Smithella sp.]HNY51511.1 GntR family transcriptional regulator [Smithella sp.]HOG90673.1 GntR family transcriptional regulator [Smithella sp.]HOU51599.1 GntR family transcriptional regulator [Smithella sp.]
MDQKLSNKIIRDIKQKILSGKLRTGDRLPAERELAEQYKVSRITIRNAISRLVYLGFMQTLPQSGTFITDFKKEASLELLVDIISSNEEVDKSILIELLELRRVFETYCAGRAVMRMTEEDRAALKDMINSLIAQKKKPEQLADIDYKIHSLLMELAGNNVLRLLFNSFKPVYQFYLKTFYSIPQNVTGIIPYYERFYNAAELRDDRIATFVMGELLDYAEQATVRLIEKLPSIKLK